MMPAAADLAHAEALKLVNRYRIGINAKPVTGLPRGVRNTSSRDPICRATGAIWVDAQNTLFPTGAAPLGCYARVFGEDAQPRVRLHYGGGNERVVQVVTPRAWKVFLAWFDRGFYPDLEEPR